MRKHSRAGSTGLVYIGLQADTFALYELVLGMIVLDGIEPGV